MRHTRGRAAELLIVLRVMCFGALHSVEERSMVADPFETFKDEVGAAHSRLEGRWRWQLRV